MAEKHPLTAYRKSAGYTQKALAGELGVADIPGEQIEDAIDHQWTKADDVPNDGGGTTNCVNAYFFYCFEQ